MILLSMYACFKHLVFTHLDIVSVLGSVCYVIWVPILWRVFIDSLLDKKILNKIGFFSSAVDFAKYSYRIWIPFFSKKLEFCWKYMSPLSLYTKNGTNYFLKGHFYVFYEIFMNIMILFKKLRNILWKHEIWIFL